MPHLTFLCQYLLAEISTCHKENHLSYRKGYVTDSILSCSELEAFNFTKDIQFIYSYVPGFLFSGGLKWAKISFQLNLFHESLEKNSEGKYNVQFILIVLWKPLLKATIPRSNLFFLKNHAPCLCKLCFKLKRANRIYK